MKIGDVMKDKNKKKKIKNKDKKFNISILILIIPIILFNLFTYFYNDYFYTLFSFIWLFFGLMIKKNQKVSQKNDKAEKNKISFKKVFNIRLEKIKKQKIQIKKISKILQLIFFLCTFFVTFLIIFQANNIENKDIFLSYLINIIKIIRHNILILALLTVFLLFLLLYKNKNYSRKNIFFSLIKIFFLWILSLIFSFLIVYFLAIVDANISGARSRLLISSLNIKVKNEDIVKKIKDMDHPVKIIGADNELGTKLIDHESIFKNHSTYYSKILFNLPKYFYISFKIPNNPMFLIGNQLVIKEVNRDSIQEIGPIIAKTYLDKYFSGRYVKEKQPIIEIINRQEYLKYRDNQINETVKEIEGQIKEIEDSMNITWSNIQQVKNNISTLQSYITLNSQYRDQEYIDCKTATDVYYGFSFAYTYRYRIYSDEQCESQKKARDLKNTEYENAIDINKEDLSYYQTQYQELDAYSEQMKNYSGFIEETKKTAPRELGLFEPDDNIKIVLESTDNKSIADFLTTLIHEYLHYSSYSSEDRSLPDFFEEGLTEYYSREIIDSQLDIKTSLGYPLITRIIEEIANKVDAKELETIYFNKDLDALQYLLDDKFGKNFYQDSELYFTLIPYLSNEEALKSANNIMYKIDGKEIREEEIYSQLSTFN